MNNDLIEVIKCECGEEHNIYSYDEPGEFPCSCGTWLRYTEYEPDFDAMFKDNGLNIEGDY